MKIRLILIPMILMYFFIFSASALALEISKNINKVALGVVEVTPSDEQSGGSGVIIDERGYIITNAHVVNTNINTFLSKASSNYDVLIAFKNGRRFIGKVIAMDIKRDLAIIKGDPAYSDFYKKNFIKIGDSDQLKLGQEVYAIGHPFRHGWSLTHGIISSIDRPGDLLGVSFENNNFIQTDAAINPGNSGGALIDSAGNLIGLTTAIIPSSRGGSTGVGFAINANQIKEFFDTIVNGKIIEKPPDSWIGIKLQYISYEDYKKNSHPKITLNSFLITELTENGPAAKGGLKQNDIIVAVDQREFLKNHELAEYIQSQPLNSIITLSIIRKKALLEIKVKTAKKPLEKIIPPQWPEEPKVWLGIKYSILAYELELLEKLHQINPLVQAQHFVVLEIIQNSPAGKAGLQIEDVIIGYDGQMPQGTEEFTAYLKEKDSGDQIILTILRGKETKIITVTLEEKPETSD